MQMIQVELLIVGDELLAGEIADANGPFFAVELRAAGLPVREMRILPDDAGLLADALRQALGRGSAVVVAGGLGPTSDDRTTEAVAAALGLPLAMDQGSWERICARFRQRGGEPPPGNEKQAMIPIGARLLPNELGTAPGYLVPRAVGGPAFVAVLPGPPRENRPMVQLLLRPWLAETFACPDRPTTQVLRCFGLPESEIGHRLRLLEQRHPTLRFGYQLRFPEILIKLRGDTAQAEELAVVTAEVRAVLAPYLYAEGEIRLPELLGRTLAARGLRLVTAESCTGGLAAKLLTDASGSSAWLERGFVTYSNEAKQELLGVPRELIAAAGAVSEPVALAMLQGALLRSAADLGMAITGIAGPGGGTPAKPVGTVCIAWGSRQEPRVRTHRFPWDRDGVRTISAWAAFFALLQLLERAAAVPHN